MGLLLSVTCRDENGTNGCHLAVFGVDVTFACDFVANVGVLVGVLVVLAMPLKNYLKWWEIQLAIHSIVGE